VVDIRLLIDGQNNLGEGPLWDAAEQKLYWIDSLDRWIFRVDADGRNLKKWPVVPVGNSVLLATDIESGDAPALCERSVA